MLRFKLNHVSKRGPGGYWWILLILTGTSTFSKLTAALDFQARCSRQGWYIRIQLYCSPGNDRHGTCYNYTGNNTEIIKGMSNKFAVNSTKYDWSWTKFGTRWLWLPKRDPTVCTIIWTVSQSNYTTLASGNSFVVWVVEGNGSGLAQNPLHSTQPHIHQVRSVWQFILQRQGCNSKGAGALARLPQPCLCYYSGDIGFYEST